MTTPGGAVSTTQYYTDGDLAQTTDADGLVTKYTYDDLGRVLTKTVVSDSYPGGLTTTYTYDALGQVRTETDPAVTDRVTGAVHTAQTTTGYDADGDVTSPDRRRRHRRRRLADGGQHLQRRTTRWPPRPTPPRRRPRTPTTPYGNLASETDPAGNTTHYTYDADGHLLTTTLQNYTGDPANPSAATNLVESTRAYDPAGRLASITDAMGRITSYTYTDNGLIATVIRSDPHTGAAFTEQSNSLRRRRQPDRPDHQQRRHHDHLHGGRRRPYHRPDTRPDRPGPHHHLRLLTRRQPGQPDANRRGQRHTGQSTSYTYDPMGNMTSQSQALQGGNPLTTTWTLDQRGLPTSMTDPDGSTTHYSYDEAGQLAVTTSPAITTQTYGGSAASTTRSR